jgi:hypothetical protein
MYTLLSVDRLIYSESKVTDEMTLECTVKDKKVTQSVEFLQLYAASNDATTCFKLRASKASGDLHVLIATTVN